MSLVTGIPLDFRKEIARITKWSPTIYFGSADGAADIEALLDLGVTAVANLTKQRWVTYDETSSIKSYLELGIDDREPIPPGKLPEFLRWMAAMQDSGHVVYMHCQAGISRTPSLLIAWLMHWTSAGPQSDLRTLWDRWLGKIGHLRPITDPHWQLKQSVLEFFATQQR